MPFELCEVRGCSGVAAKKIIDNSRRHPEYRRVCIECERSISKGQIPKIKPVKRREEEPEPPEPPRPPGRQPLDEYIKPKDTRSLHVRVFEAIPHHSPGITISGLTRIIGEARFRIKRVIDEMIQARTIYETDRDKISRYQKSPPKPKPRLRQTKKKIPEVPMKPKQLVSKNPELEAQQVYDVLPSRGEGLTLEELSERLQMGRPVVDRAVHELVDSCRAAFGQSRHGGPLRFIKAGKPPKPEPKPEPEEPASSEHLEELGERILELREIVKKDPSRKQELDHLKVAWMEEHDRLEERG